MTDLISDKFKTALSFVMILKLSLYIFYTNYDYTTLAQTQQTEYVTR